MRQQRLSDDRTASHDKVEDAVWKPALCNDLGQCEAAARHKIGGLEDDAITVAERRRDFPCGNRDREIPGTDDPDDPDWFARQVDFDAGPNRRAVLARNPKRLARKKCEDLTGARHFADTFGQCLAFFA